MIYKEAISIDDEFTEKKWKSLKDARMRIGNVKKKELIL